jgi:drug/metabolite transporter (DMT)-like permease
VLVALVVLSAFLHAAWNALLKREADKDHALIAAVTVATTLATVVAAVRWAMLAELPFETATGAAWALVAGVVELAYFLSLARALDGGALGPIYTISRGGAVVVVYPLSIALFHETPTLVALAGSAIVVGGLVLSGTQQRPTNGANHTGRGGGGLGWAIVCAISIAGYHLAYKAALSAGGNPSAVFAVALALATAANFARTGATGRRAVAALWRTGRRRVLAMGLLCGGSFLVLLEALSSGDAGFVLTLRNTSVLFATALAWAIGERPRVSHAVGAALVAAGAIVMAS